MNRKKQNYAFLIMGILILISSLTGFIYTSKPNWFLALGIGIGIMAVSLGINRILINYSIGNDNNSKEKITSTILGIYKVISSPSLTLVPLTKL